MISASAPGKVVLWGEYAVLRGAPALVMAVNRAASCTIEAGGEQWQFESRGFDAAVTTLSREALRAGPRPSPSSSARLAWHILRHIDAALLPAGGRVETDSRAFYQAGDKLGIGSSAAICTAGLGAFAALLDEPLTYPAALAAHREAQNRQGSGIDVAASFHGGLLKFQNARIEPATLPDGMHMVFVWTGKPARTTDHLARFAHWLETGDLAPLAALRETAESLFATHDVWRDLARYTACLKVLDQAAGLGIYGPAHIQLEQLANGSEVVYKPCGAGGGDVGVAFSDRIGRLEAFAQTATTAGYHQIPLEKAEYGIRVAR